MNLGGDPATGHPTETQVIGPNSQHPFVIRDLRIWDCHWAFTPATPGLLVDKLDVAHSEYGFWKPNFDRHAYRGLTIYQCGKAYANINGRPPDPSAFPSPLGPIDDRPPVTAITDVEALDSGQIRVAGCSADDGPIKSVRVNGQEVRPLVPDYSRWEADPRTDPGSTDHPERGRRGRFGERRANAPCLDDRDPTGRRDEIDSPASSNSLTADHNRIFNEEEAVRIRDSFGSTTINRPRFAGAIAIATFILATSSQARAQGWPNYAHDPQHSCMAAVGSQVPRRSDGRLRRPGPSNLNKQRDSLHPLRVAGDHPDEHRARAGQDDLGWELPGRGANATTGNVIWRSPVSGFTLPSHDWIPIFGITLTPNDKHVVYPGPGGTIYARTFPNAAVGMATQFAFFNPTASGTTTNLYGMNPTAFNNAIQVCTPISSDAQGNLFFGYTSSGAALPGYPNGIGGGLARVSNTGVGSFVAEPAQITSRSQHAARSPTTCAPAFKGADGSHGLRGDQQWHANQTGYLCARQHHDAGDEVRIPPSSIASSGAPRRGGRRRQRDSDGRSRWGRLLRGPGVQHRQ